MLHNVLAICFGMWPKQDRNLRKVRARSTQARMYVELDWPCQLFVERKEGKLQQTNTPWEGREMGREMGR